MIRLLVIGYGNELRGDDAVGPRLARAVEGWRLPGVEAIASHGLTPELAEPISRAEKGVIFVDAAESSGVGVSELSPAGPTAVGHTSQPGWLLALAESLYGRCPRAWLVTVPAADFGFGEGLSPRATEGVTAALEEVRRLLDEAQRASSQTFSFTRKP